NRHRVHPPAQLQIIGAQTANRPHFSLCPAVIKGGKAGKLPLRQDLHQQIRPVQSGLGPRLLVIVHHHHQRGVSGPLRRQSGERIRRRRLLRFPGLPRRFPLGFGRHPPTSHRQQQQRHSEQQRTPSAQSDHSPHEIRSYSPIIS